MNLYEYLNAALISTWTEMFCRKLNICEVAERNAPLDVVLNHVLFYTISCILRIQMNECSYDTCDAGAIAIDPRN